MASIKQDDHQVVLVEDPNSFVRIVTLNRPQQMNALSDEMVTQLRQQVLAHQQDDNLKLLILRGQGRAFSSGADIAAVARHLFAGDWRRTIKINDNLYKLLYLVATNSKPQVALLNGFVAGSGAGISIHGRFRVATENTVFCMPETNVGGLPDVGSAHFLSRLDGFLGEYLGLTGARLYGPEMLACGLATHFVPSSKLELLQEALVSKVASADNVSSNDDVAAVIKEFSDQPTPGERSPLYKMDVINKCFSKGTAEEILSALDEEEAARTSKTDDVWLSSTIRSLKKACPTSLKVALRSIREGRRQGVVECLACDYRVSCQGLRGNVSTDFKEGIRAILLDKDNNPKWNPSRLELVTDEIVEALFSKFDDGDELKEFQVPNGSKL